VTQAELVERARAGDHDAFEMLVRPSIPRLYGAAKLILRQPDRAEDALQEALVLAWRNLRALREPAAWEAWLYRLTIRSCHHLAGRHQRNDAIAFRPDLEVGAQGDFSPDVAERDRLGRQLGRLPVDQRTVLVLHFYLDLPLSDAAEILDIPIGTAKSRLHRALESMRIGMGVEPEATTAVRAERPT
jgi:RNA polymerase sigma-70 factor (ECF subfamily)